MYYTACEILTEVVIICALIFSCLIWWIATSTVIQSFFPSFSQVAQVETIWLFCLYYIASLFNPCGNLKLTHFTRHAANQWAGSYFLMYTYTGILYSTCG